MYAVFADVHIVKAAFNPITFHAALWSLFTIGFVMNKDVPIEKICKQRRGTNE